MSRDKRSSTPPPPPPSEFGAGIEVASAADVARASADAAVAAGEDYRKSVRSRLATFLAAEGVKAGDDEQMIDWIDGRMKQYDELAATMISAEKALAVVRSSYADHMKLFEAVVAGVRDEELKGDHIRGFPAVSVVMYPKDLAEIKAVIGRLKVAIK